jgi:hypothetical protein
MTQCAAKALPPVGCLPVDLAEHRTQYDTTQLSAALPDVAEVAGQCAEVQWHSHYPDPYWYRDIVCVAVLIVSSDARTAQIADPAFVTALPS